MSQPDCGKPTLEITEQLAQLGAVDLLLVDSVAATVPKTEPASTMEDT
jgi:recombination protein RecA